jgi:hypothetical protein
MTVAKQKHNPSDVGLTTSHWQSLLDTVQLDPRLQTHLDLTIYHNEPSPFSMASRTAYTHTSHSHPPTLGVLTTLQCDAMA